MRRSGFAFLLLFSLAAFGQTVPIPFIDQPLSPTTALPGSQGFTLTVSGANFAPTAVLEWNGSQRRTAVVSNALLQATINTSDLTRAGTAAVTVVNLGTNSLTSNTALFTIRKPAPAVSLVPDPNFLAPGLAVVGDFNNDGKPDVATSSRNPKGAGSVITVYFGKGQGKFQPGIETFFAGKHRFQEGYLLAGDFNGDHNLDLAVLSPSGLAVVLGDGKGKFTFGSLTGIGKRGNMYAVADVNGDGNLDLLIAVSSYGGGGYAGVLFGKGDGSFGSGPQISVPNSPGSPVLGDFNEDGNLDLAVPDSGMVYVALNQGNGNFSTPVAYKLPSNSGNIVTADTDGDGHMDIVSDAAAVLLGKGDGTFTNGEGVVYSSGGTPIIADFNGDGKLDLFFLGTFPNLLMLGNGDGTFQPPAPAGNAISLPGRAGLADFNHDGHLDLVTGGVFWQVSAGLYPAYLNYQPQNIGTSSPPQTASLVNAGSTPLNVTSIKIGGTNAQDFTQTNNCPNSVPVGSSCQIQVVFTPTAQGSRQASLNVTYAGNGSPQAVALSGTGVAVASVSLTPSKLAYPTQLVNTTSAPQTATLTNTGSSDVAVSNIYTSETSFTETNNCPGTLPVGKSCQIQVTFAPTQNGPASGMLLVSDNAPDSPQTVALSGLGTTITFKPIGFNFGDQKVGTKSAPVPITFSNKGTVALNISQIALGGTNPGDFSQTNDCPATLPAGSNCTIQVTFKPTQKGARSAELQVSDDANPSPQQAAVGGTST